ncbi:MAG: HAD family phosphatase [Lachnospiraceae bacterium]|nr:HAD family phosphatase [Lachnospiraceae bacterium]
MIKNIVFDMGKVLVDYRADRVCRKVTNDEAEIKNIVSNVFESQEWTLLDIGLISEEEALQTMLKRTDSPRERELTKFSFEHWHEYNLMPVAAMGDLIQKLKSLDYNIYLCSNASVRLLTCYQKAIPAIECFSGVLFSAGEKLLKPQKEIYLRLFEKFHLNPAECFFIDDLQRNIDGARECGMDGYCFKDFDIEKLAERLEQLNKH